MKTRYLLVADGLEALNPEFDLGVCLSTELLSRGIAVDYMDLPAADADQQLDGIPRQPSGAGNPLVRRGQEPILGSGPRSKS